MTILGISVGTTNTGVCVMRDDALLERQIHSYHVPPWSDNKMRTILNRYREHIVNRKVTAIIVKEPLLKRQNEHIALLLKGIEQLAEEHGCSYSTTTKRNIKVALDMSQKDGIAEYALLLYPELSRPYERGNRSDHRYYNKMYEAVLAAHIYAERLRVQTLQKARTGG